MPGGIAYRTPPGHARLIPAGFNPDPQETVHWGDQTWEEMLAAFMDFAIDIDTDPATIAASPAPSGPTPSNRAADSAVGLPARPFAKRPPIAGH